MEEMLIWVDENDREIGYGNKMETHRLGQLHRAFSLFVFSREDKKMLLHQRADGKYHSGGLWTNACCSHPRRGEEIREAVVRRAREELGLVIPFEGEEPEEVGSFRYYQSFAACAEHEVDHVFLLMIGSSASAVLRPDPEEIKELCWIGLPELEEWMRDRPGDFTAWFPMALSLIRKHLPEG